MQHDSCSAGAHYSHQVGSGPTCGSETESFAASAGRKWDNSNSPGARLITRAEAERFVTKVLAQMINQYPGKHGKIDIEKIDCDAIMEMEAAA
jgi:hypothetical protein